MQIYAMKLNYFLRYGETDNCIIFDLKDKDIIDLKQGNKNIDDLYSEIMRGPVSYIERVKKDGLNSIIAICGEKNDSEEGSNGSGKSTIMEAMCYGFYNRFIRKSANSSRKGTPGFHDIITTFKSHKDGKLVIEHPEGLRESYVEILFEEKGNIYKLKRGVQVSAKLNKNSFLEVYSCRDKQKYLKADADAFLEKLLDCPFDVFVNSQMFGQADAGEFLSGTDKSRKDILSMVLNMDEIVKGMQKRVSQELTSLEKKHDLKKEELAKVYTEVNSEDNKDLSEKITAVKKEIFNLNAQLRFYNKDLDGVRNNSGLKNLEYYKKDLDNIIKLVTPSKNLHNEKIEKFNMQISNLTKDISNNNNFISKYKQEIDKKSVSILSNQKSLKKKKTRHQVLDEINKSQKLIKSKSYLENKLNSSTEQYNLLNSEYIIKEENLKSLVSEAKKIKADLEGDELICNECGQKISKELLANKLDDKKNTYQKNKKELEALKEKKENTEKEKKELEISLNNINVVREKIKSLKSEVEEIDRIQLEVQDLELSVEKLNEEIKTLDLETKKHEELLKIINEEVQKENIFYRESQKENAKNYKELKEKISLLEVECEPRLIELKQLEDKINEHNKFISDKNIELGKVEKQQEILILKQKELAALNTQFKASSDILYAHKVLSRIFSLDGLQSKIIEKYLPVLNLYVNDSLSYLSDGDISVEFSMNESGKIDFDIVGAGGSSFDMLSGGEKTLVRLAVDIGLSLLYFNRTSKLPEMINLDEVFGALDVKYARNALNLVKGLNEKFARILVISHNDYVKNEIETRLYVSKDPGFYGLSKIKV